MAIPLGTLDRTPPPFFKPGLSALSKLALFSALALFLMVADLRFELMRPIRATLATAMYPLQQLALQPVRAAQEGRQYFSDLRQARQSQDQAHRQLAQQAARAAEVEQLRLENTRLRALLGMRERQPLGGQAAEVLYDAADPYTRKVFIDQGQVQGLAAGAPVLDEAGVLGQVTRLYPLMSEVTLLIDRDQSTPIMNARTGVRGVAYGDPSSLGGALELRYMPANADLQPGDLLVTSGVDGVYPPGLPVARIERVEKRADSAFVRVHCMPQANVLGARHVLVLPAGSGVQPPQPAAPPPAPASRDSTLRRSLPRGGAR